MKANSPKSEKRSTENFDIHNISHTILQSTNPPRTPYFLFDKQNTLQAAQEFKSVFTNHIQNFKPFYAVKSNPYEGILHVLADQKYGFDVSSGRELLMVEKLGRPILFTGPGKTREELESAIRSDADVTINVDSFGELRRIKEIAREMKRKVRVGVRIRTPFHGIWDKFGIPLADLGAFCAEADTDYVSFEGIQTHMSWNTSAKPYIEVLSQIGKYLQDLPEKYQSRIRYIDFGGGFIPHPTEMSIEKGNPYKHIKEASVPLGTYAEEIGKAVSDYFSNIPECAFYSEPGRIISQNSMHIVLKVIDVKSDTCVITDGGTNIIGWEKFEETYAPIYNITKPASAEKRAVIYGSLCTPHDIWGYQYFGSGITEGDILVIPNQGAYTYTLTQEFIKDKGVVRDIL